MQTIFRAGLVRDDLEEDIAFEQLCNLLPTSQYKWHFHNKLWTAVYLECDQNDPRSQQFLNAMEAFQVKPRAPFLRANKSNFEMTYFRKYDEADWKEAEFLQPDPVSHVGWTVDRSRYGRLKLKKNHIRLRNYLGKADWPWLVVSDDIRQKMEKAKLKGLVFHETEAAGEILKDAANQIWELDASVELPAMSPKCQFVHYDGAPFTGDYSRGRALIEGFYSPEFRYSRADIQSVGEFDLARTHERWGDADSPRKLVCSRRFYEFCNAHKIKMNWTPVRIDPD